MNKFYAESRSVRATLDTFAVARTVVGKLFAISTVLLLAACGGSSSGGDSAAASGTYTVAGSISGLTAAGLVLQNNAGDNLIVAANATAFQFATPINAGSDYSVTVATQPIGLTCTISHGAGTNVSAAVTNINVVCSANTHTISGTISGLTSNGLVLQNNGADNLTIAANATTFQFAAPIAAGGGYNVTAFTQPAGLVCTVNNGVASNVTANVTNIHIVCNAITFTVGGTISGLTGNGLVLQNNNGDNLTIASNATTFEFATPVAQGGGYAVTVLTQPTGQYCSLTSAAGTANMPISDVALVCTQATLTPSVAAIALSVNNTGVNAALTGNARQITITNNGTVLANNLSIAYPAWPSGTSVASTCAATLAPSASCTITITPGANPTSNCNTGVAPTPDTITVSADDAPSSTIDAVVLTYGCIYQQGFIYSIDDTTSTTGSIGGKTAALTDTIPGTGASNHSTAEWGAYGTAIGANLEDTSSQGANDGSANTAAIVSALTTNYGAAPYNGSSPVPTSDYAAGLCSTLTVDSAGNSPCASGSCYTGWHLPAICELAPFGGICTSGSTNMQQQLFEASPAIAALGLAFPAIYWSSTESSLMPAGAAIGEIFNSGGGSFQQSFDKTYIWGVRCSRALTQ